MNNAWVIVVTYYSNHYYGEVLVNNPLVFVLVAIVLVTLAIYSCFKVNDDDDIS